LSDILQSLPSTHPRSKVNIETFEKLPLSKYSDWEKYNEKRSQDNALCSNIVRYQPTSGSSHKIKWIPYNNQQIRAFDRSISVWMYELYSKYPRIKGGTHYWSISWLPDEYRNEFSNDDSEILAPIKKTLYQRIFAVPSSVASTDTLEQSLNETAKALIKAKDLTLISVWSPTFLISIFDTIIRLRPEFKTYSDVLSLWPKLALVSFWDTSTSKFFADKIKAIFKEAKVSSVQFEGKGLWSTEAVVTIPYDHTYILSYRSHYYEFYHLNDSKVLKSWELKVNDEVSPIVTTQNGLLRYKMNDKLVVTGFKNDVPVLTFLERIQDSDMVGEKLSTQFLTQLLSEEEVTSSMFIAVANPKIKSHPYYILLTSDKKLAVHQIEKKLNQSFHYKLARDLNQLGELEVLHSTDTLLDYQKICRQKGMIEGNIKLETVIQIESDEFRYE
jgi:hypothetical protein